MKYEEKNLVSGGRKYRGIPHSVCMCVCMVCVCLCVLISERKEKKINKREYEIRKK